MIQLAESFADLDSSVTSSKKFAKSLSAARREESYSLNSYSLTNLNFFSLGISGICSSVSLINLSPNTTGNRSGSGKYL